MPIDYDPLLAKLIGYGQDRQQAIARLARALQEYFVAGIKTNLGLFRRILADQDFQSGKIDTGYLDRLLAAKTGRRSDVRNSAEIAAIAAAVFALLDSTAIRQRRQRSRLSKSGGSNRQSVRLSSWKRAARTDGV